MPPGANLSHAPLVGNGPGEIAFNLIPLFPHSAARDLVIVAKPDLDIADGTVYGPLLSIHVVKIEIILPFKFSANHLLPIAFVM